MAAKVLFLSAFVFVAVLDVIEAHGLSCYSNQFQCFSGSCILRTWFCDNVNDCSDKSDERYCDINALNTSCPRRWILCQDSKRCIPREWKCDGRKDCLDRSDEDGCAEDFYLPTEATTRIFEYSDFITVTDETFYLPTTSHDASIFRIYSGYRGPEIRFALALLTRRLLEARQETRSINKWGPQLPRSTVALFLANSSYFVPGNRIGNEIAYELSLQMMSKLSLKRKVSIHELSLYINALTVSCINPRDFFGVNLVAELRIRVNNSNYTNPSVFLTLCNAGDSMTQTDVQKVNSTFYARLRPLWTEIQAFATMAMACISTRSSVNASEEILSEMVAELKRKQPKNGTNGNLKTTALVLQALISTDSYRDDFKLSGALKFVLRQLNRSYTSLQDMYYVLPVLNSKSLVNISSNHCTLPVITELEMLKKFREHQDERVQARVSMFIGEEKDFVRNWKLKVPSNYSLYQVLESIALLEPAYKVYYSVSEDKKPRVTGLSVFFDDVADGLYWFIYAQNLKDTAKPRLVKKSPVDIPLKEDEELILWYRSGEWADPH